MVSHLIVTQEGVVTGAYLDTTLLAMLASLIVPLVVSVITKKTASDAVRALTNIVATAVMAALALWANPSGVPVTWQLVVNTMLLSLVTSFASYKGIWKPTGVTGTLSEKTASFGIGSSQYVGEHVAPEDDEPPIDLDNDGIPDDLDDEGLDDLVAGVDTDAPVIEEDK